MLYSILHCMPKLIVSETSGYPDFSEYFFFFFTLVMFPCRCDSQCDSGYKYQHVCGDLSTDSHLLHTCWRTLLCCIHRCGPALLYLSGFGEFGSYSTSSSNDFSQYLKFIHTESYQNMKLIKAPFLSTTQGRVELDFNSQILKWYKNTIIPHLRFIVLMLHYDFLLLSVDQCAFCSVQSCRVRHWCYSQENNLSISLAREDWAWRQLALGGQLLFACKP